MRSHMLVLACYGMWVGIPPTCVLYDRRFPWGRPGDMASIPGRIKITTAGESQENRSKRSMRAA